MEGLGDLGHYPGAEGSLDGEGHVWFGGGQVHLRASGSGDLPPPRMFQLPGTCIELCIQ